MSLTIRTDLALENREIYLKARKIDETVPGVEIETDDTINEVFVTKVHITSTEGANSLQKPIGTYITIESKKMNSELEEIDNSIVHCLATHLKALSQLSQEDNVLVVGLGNHDVTPDALGPSVIKQVCITKHLLEYAPEYLPKRTRAVSAIIPGVLGTTGIETSEIVKGIVDKTHPNLVFVIDALASKSIDRVGKTIQLSDTGIIPGSGVGNSRFAITKAELNVPVIVIGVPTVVGIPTIVEDTLTAISEKTNDETLLHAFDSQDSLQEICKDHHYNFMVTPKDIDDIITNLSGILAKGINLALNDTLV